MVVSMQLDTRIPLMAQGPQIESPINALFNATRLRSAEAQMGEQERQIGERNALAAVLRQPDTFGTDGRFNRAALPAIAQAAPGAVPQYAGLANQQDVTQDQSEVRKMQAAKQSMEMQGRLLQGVRDEQSYQAAKQQAQQYGIDVSQLPPNYDPAFVKQALARTMSQMDQFDMLYKQHMMNGLSAPQQSSEGFFAADKRGNVTILKGPDGKPLMPTTIDPNAQGSVAEAKARGTAQGKAQVANEQGFGQAEATANQIIGVIDKAMSHPGREYSTGMSSMLPVIAGSDASDFRAVLDQIKGQAFLQAFESLKGGGQITEVEGQKATQAIARLDTAQSEEEFLRSLQDLRQIVGAGLERARRKAGGTAQASPAGAGGVLSPAQATTAPAATRTKVRSGTLDGRKVVEYSDGSVEYAD
jgi:hypothetical protein